MLKSKYMGSFALYGIFTSKLLILSDSLSLFVKKGVGGCFRLREWKTVKKITLSGTIYCIRESYFS